MGATHLSFQNKQVPAAKLLAKGLFTVSNSGSFRGGNLDSAQFAICTGSSDVPDLTYNGGPVTLLADADIPAKCRCYVTRLDIAVNGPTAWSGGNYVALQDNASAPLAYLPTNALRSLAAYTMPDSDVSIPLLLGAGQTSTLASYASGVITLSTALYAGTTYDNKYVGLPITVVSGTGAGQSAIITANTGTTLTVSPGFSVPIDATSVLALWYWVASAGAASSITLSGANFATNALDNGYNAVVVSGTSVGSVRPISANTATALTSAYAYNTTPAQFSVTHVNNEGNLNGVLDLAIGAHLPAATLGRGLQLVVAGTMTQGSPIRAYVEGYFAP